jgi:hypothetical protein
MVSSVRPRNACNRVTTLFGYVLAGILLLGFVGPASAEVTVSVDRHPLRVNESFRLIFSSDDTPNDDPDFSILRQHFTILGNKRGSSTRIVDGQYQRRIDWTLQLMPKQVGEVIVPAIGFDDERSEPLKITVMPAVLTAVPRDELVLQLFADIDQVYVQGQVVLTQRLLSEADNSAYQFADLGVGSLEAVIEPLGGERQYQARIAGHRYLVRERQYALFPQQSGRLEIGPALAETARYDFFGIGGARRIRSRPLALEVRPIPADYRGAYWLPATRLELQDEWRGDTAALIAGEPVTRVVTLLADGLTAAQLPEIELPAIDGIRQYPEQPGLGNSRTRGGVRGQREQQVALIPGAAGVYRVPELRLPWWNLATGRMEVAILPARELTVVPAASPAEAETEAGAQAENPTLAPAPAAAAGNHWWPWLSLLLGCGWAASGFYRWTHSRRATPPPQNEPLQAARRQLHDSCAANDASAARCALLDWGRALLAPREIANLQQLGRVFGDPLVGQIEALDRSLYAKQHDTWHGGELADLCRRLERQQPEPCREQAGSMPPNPAAGHYA